MDRLSIYLTMMTGAVLTGSFVIVVFSLGYYGWPVIIGAVIMGYALSWPAAYVISRQIKRNDGNWDEGRAKRTDAIPRINEPEV